MIIFLTNADTELLSLRAVVEGLPEGFPAVRAANPHRLDGPIDLDGATVVVVRLLGGRRAWEGAFDELAARCRRRGIPLLAFGGEATADPELTRASTVPAATVVQALDYLVQGGLANLEQLLRFVVDTVLMEGFGFEPPEVVPDHGILPGWPHPDARRSAPGGAEPTRPTGADLPVDRPGGEPRVPLIGVIFYRAHLVAGNTRFVEDLCRAIEVAGGRALPVYCYSLRAPHHDARAPVVELLAEAGVDAVVATVLAAGTMDGPDGGWDPGALASLDVPVIQGLCATTSSAAWQASSQGISPLDAAWTVAIPEFDGRIVSVPFTFKEQVDEGVGLGVPVEDRVAVAPDPTTPDPTTPDPTTPGPVPALPVTAYRTVGDRTTRVAELAVRTAGLRHLPAEHKKVAIVLSAYPTKRSRLGNAVGLDTPASVLRILHQLRAAGHRVERIPATGDELMAELADSLAYEAATLGPQQSARAAGRWEAEQYVRWFETRLPEPARQAVEAAWGPAPGRVYVEDAPPEDAPAPPESAPAAPAPPESAPAAAAQFVFSGLDLGGVLVAIQPPRGFGENPVAIYHSPDLPPTHHYLAFYRWLDEQWGADAIVHVGKHGTLEWLPGKGVGLSAACFPDAALGSVPMVYPFVVNDPGEGAQAKRRAHAVIIDHLVPPMTRADTYDELARLESLLDAHAQLLALDPAKLPAIRRQVWELMVEAEIHRDLGFGGGRTSAAAGPEPPSFDDPSFDDLLVEVDGYLCELKDAQIRGGLHVLGEAPEGRAELEMVAAITRLAQGPGGAGSLRRQVADDLGVDLGAEGAPGHRSRVDQVEAECLRRLELLQQAGWDLDAVPDGRLEPAATLEWICRRLVPALRATHRELGAVLAALGGRFVKPGPSGAPTRGMAHVLPTGRNFYSVDPKAIPSPLAWEVGRQLADQLIERHRREEGRPPASVGLVVWGTSAMRTGGDDIAEALALLGVRPTWAAESGRVDGLELVPLAELGRARVDVTVRVSGFFRDAFPHVLALLDQAVALAAAAVDEPAEANPVAASGTADPRVFGPKPGAYGSGILSLLEAGNWRGDHDLAEVYLAWGGYAYGADGTGRPAPEALRRRLASVEVAVKNQDNREHDIFDSDDYLQDHGGMVATIRALTGRQPKAWFGDSADPSRPRVRSLAEEAARVVRSRVVNPKWVEAMRRHGYKGAFEMAATVDYLFGYDATAGVAEDWMYERVTERYVGDPEIRKFFEQSNPWALRAIAERLLEADQRGLWQASPGALATLRSAVLEAEGWEEGR